MRKTGSRVLGAAAVLLALASSAFAIDTVAMELTSTGLGSTMGGVFTSPYGVSIGGTPTLLICDDFSTDVSVGDTWSATVLTLVDLQNRVGLPGETNPITPKFAPGGVVTNAIVAKYAVAGVLAAQLMSHLGSSYNEGQIRGELSFALWAVFDPALLQVNLLGLNPYLNLIQLTAAKAYLLAAELVVAAATVGGVLNGGSINMNLLPFANLNIYTPSGPNGLASSQEFLGVSSVSMPEPSSIAILALDLLGLAGLVFFVRRRGITVS